jgi:hypothetical protein
LIVTCAPCSSASGSAVHMCGTGAVRVRYRCLTCTSSSWPLTCAVHAAGSRGTPTCVVGSSSFVQPIGSGLIGWTEGAVHAAGSSGTPPCRIRAWPFVHHHTEGLAKKCTADGGCGAALTARPGRSTHGRTGTCLRRDITQHRLTAPACPPCPAGPCTHLLHCENTQTHKLTNTQPHKTAAAPASPPCPAGPAAPAHTRRWPRPWARPARSRQRLNIRSAHWIGPPLTPAVGHVLGHDLHAIHEQRYWIGPGHGASHGLVLIVQFNGNVILIAPRSGWARPSSPSG